MQLDLGAKRPHAVAAKSAAGIVRGCQPHTRDNLRSVVKRRRTQVSVHLSEVDATDQQNRRARTRLLAREKVAGFD